MVIRTLYAIQRESSPVSSRDKTWSSAHFLPSRDNQVRWHTETNMVIHAFFAIQRQLSRMSCRDKTISSTTFFPQGDNQVRWHTRETWSSTPSLPSRDNQVWWHAKTKHGHLHPFCYPERIKSDGMQRQSMVIRTFFAIQRQSSPIARGDKTWSSAPFLQSRDNQVWWHVETNMVIRTVLAIQRQWSLMARGDKTWSSAPSLPSKDN